MEHNNFSPLEPENVPPEQTEEIPVIEELTFQPAPAPREEPEAASDTPAPEEAVPEKDVTEKNAPEEDVTEKDSPEEDVMEKDSPEEDVTEKDSPEEAVREEAVPAPEAESSTIESEKSIPEAESSIPEPENPETALPEQPADPFADLLIQPDMLDVSLPEQPAQTPAEEPQDQLYRDDSKDFDTLMKKPPAPEPRKTVPTEPAVTQKGRPRRKKGEGLLGIPSILATFVWLVLVVAIGVTAGRMLWICAADVLAFGREDKVVTVTVYEADTMDDIIDKLYDGGLIRYKGLFRFYAGISDAQEDIKPGIYDLNTRYDYHALVNFMSPRSSREVIKLTIPEGYTCRQIFALLEENRICTAVDAAAYAANGELADYWFLESVERGTSSCLEGYLFPDTYEFYKNSTPREAIEKMLDNFEHRFDGDLLTLLEDLNKKVTDGSYTTREIVIIASLIEKESAAPGESPKVAGVIYNRLFDWGSNPPYLNIDATIVYAQEGDNARIDTSLDSPYNTYTNEGLPPGPIANPGLSSLKAALDPESHNYYYYVLNPSTGMHQFSTTYEEHSNYVRQFAAASEES